MISALIFYSEEEAPPLSDHLSSLTRGDQGLVETLVSGEGGSGEGDSDGDGSGEVNDSSGGDGDKGDEGGDGVGGDGFGGDGFGGDGDKGDEDGDGVSGDGARGGGEGSSSGGGEMRWQQHQEVRQEEEGNARGHGGEDMEEGQISDEEVCLLPPS